MSPISNWELDDAEDTWVDGFWLIVLFISFFVVILHSVSCPHVPGSQDPDQVPPVMESANTFVAFSHIDDEPTDGDSAAVETSDIASLKLTCCFFQR